MVIEEMTWDLSQMVEFDDPGYISERLTAMVKVTEEFRDQHRGKIKDYSAKQVFDMVEQVDNLWLQYEGPFMYSWLAYQADMSEDAAKQLFENLRQAMMLVEKATAFIDLELGQLISEKPEIIDTYGSMDKAMEAGMQVMERFAKKSGKSRKVVLGDPVKCPHCNAAYKYPVHIMEAGQVECQNCGKPIHL
jgi:oligoendopeptidase F